MVNSRFCETARLISFLQGQDFVSLAKEINTLRRHPRKIQDDETLEIRLKFCKKQFLKEHSPPLILLTFNN